jgi:hypothetical protein
MGSHRRGRIDPGASPSIPSVPEQDCLPVGAQTGLGLGATGYLSGSFGGPFRVDPQGVHLDLGGHPGPGPYCARNAGAWKGACGESFQRGSVHAGPSPFVPPLPEGQSETTREPGAGTSALPKGPPGEPRSDRGQGLERRAGGQMAQGLESHRSPAARASPKSPRAFLFRPVSS